MPTHTTIPDTKIFPFIIYYS